MASSGPPSSSARTAFFQKLKPLCIPLSHLAIRSEDKAAHAKEIQDLLEQLLETWLTQVRQDSSILDDRLADYVFFPVSHVLRSQDLYPILVIEITIKLLRALIQNGWRSKISNDLAQQLLIFLAFIIGGVPGQPRKRTVPEETVLEGYRALGSLLGCTGSAVSALLEDKMVPTIGHAVSVILEGVTEGTTPETQLEALECLEALYTSIKDQSVLASFLPGTISSLARLLAPPTSLKTPTRILIKGMRVLQVVLVNVLGDMKNRNLLKEVKDGKPTNTLRVTEQAEEAKPKETEPEATGSIKVLTRAWLRATASQIKIALASILKLRAHDSDNVQEALHKLCISLLDECHTSLADCKTMLVETAMATQEEDVSGNHRNTTLEDMAGIYPELGDTVRSVMYNWVTGLPRMMQSSEERVKQQAIRNFLKGNKLVAMLQLESLTLEDSIADALKDSVVALIKNSKQPGVTSGDADESSLRAVTLTTLELTVKAYRPVILASDGQRGTRREVESLVASIGSPAQQVKLASEMLSSLRDSEGVDQIASFWLSFELVKATYNASSNDELDSYLDLSSTAESAEQTAVFHELYDFSATVIASHSDMDEVDWRLEAIALEVAAFASSRMQQEFRPELIDVLYPITTFMGSQNRQLRSHAITTLNIIATSCGYKNVSDLIIDNVDYMVNSLSIRLNTFDISPASTRVLTMMIRLSGPKLIPFLDDVVASIFAALDNYHGYPVFVESLFSVLSEVVEQGSKSDALLLTSGGETIKPDRKKKPAQSESTEGLLSLFSKRRERLEKQKEETEPPTSHPKKPWGPPKDAKPKSFLETFEEIHPSPSEDQEEPPPGDQQQLDAPKPPPTPTYTLLTRITTLTQHHLTSPSPTLRRRLLELLSRAAPALAADEDSFLPLVNAVWPVMISRLRDGEPFVVVAACDALAALCENAGDFLASRVKTEWGEWTGRWCGRVKGQAGVEVGERRKGMAGGGTTGGKRGGQVSGSFLGRSYGGTAGGSGGGDILLPMRGGIKAAEPAMLSSTPLSDLKLVQESSISSGSVASRSTAAAPGSGPSGLGKFSQASQVWSAVVRLLTAIVSYVRLDDGIFDQILELLIDVAVVDMGVRGALEDVNADAVWLALYERGKIEVHDIKVPVVDGVRFVPLVKFGTSS
ncbi:armadillo-type protein [Coniochaeta sp. 2T2.1]|nr:armadillo-type protein [Coniochaeta sp. 2T2.1]